jgi:hypothetical protein
MATLLTHHISLSAQWLWLSLVLPPPHRRWQRAFVAAMDRIGADVFIHHIAPFFVFEASRNPTRGATSGHLLLQLRKWTPAQAVMLKSVMHHVFSRMGDDGLTIWESAADGITHLRADMLFTPPAWFPRWLLKWITRGSWHVWVKLDLSDYRVNVLLLDERRWHSRPHPIKQLLVQLPRRWGKTL